MGQQKPTMALLVLVVFSALAAGLKLGFKPNWFDYINHVINMQGGIGMEQTPSQAPSASVLLLLFWKCQSPHQKPDWGHVVA